MAKGTARHGTARLFAAALAAAAVAIALGPDEMRYQSFAIGMSVLVLLGGWIRAQTNEGGLIDRIATGALGLLLLAPAMGTRVRMVSEALSSVDSTSPHTAVASLPSTASDVVQSTGPLMLGAGLALLILAGRLGGPVTGALLGGATAAWAGQTIAQALDKAIGAERFGDLVMLSQGLSFVGLLTVIGALAGAVLARQGRSALMVRRLVDLREAKVEAVREARRAQKIAEAQAKIEAQSSEEETEQGTDGAAEDADIVVDEPEISPERAADLEAISTALYATPLLHALDDDEIESIAPSFERQLIEGGHDLFAEGEKDETIYIVSRGEVQIWKRGTDKPRFLLARLSAGMMFGEMAVVESRPRSASATTFGQVELVRLNGEAFRALSKSKPMLASKVQLGLIQVIAERLRKTSLDLLQVSQGETVDPGESAPKVAKRKGTKVNPEEVAALVSPARLFQSLEEEEFQAIAPSVDRVDFEDGDHLVAVGTNEATMYLLTEGRVQIWRRNAAGQKVELAILGPGDPIGEMALYEDGQRTANATAIGEVQTVRFTRSSILKLTKGHPDVAVKLQHAFLEVLSERLRTTSSNLVEVSEPTRPPLSRPDFVPSQAAAPKEEEGELQDMGDLAASPGDADDDDILDELTENGSEKQAKEEEEEEEEEIIVEVHPEEVDPDVHLSEVHAKRHRRTAGGLALLATLSAYWASSPPWLSLIQNLPSPATNAAVPRTEPGLPNAQRPMNPFGPDFAAALEGRGHERLHSRPWPCLPDVYDRQNGYGSHPRKTETLAVAADTLVVDLTPAVHDMRKRGVYRMGLTGSAKPPYGLLGSFLAWPAVQLLIDSPPRTAQWFKVHPRSVEKLPLLPGATSPTACALIVDAEITVDQLYATVRSLGSVFGDASCQQAVVLVLPDDGSTTNPHPGWKGCP